MGKIHNPERVTLSDVADAAGVSAITVSRALRQPHKVSPLLRERIGEAVAALGYMPDPAARALASQRTNIIGALIPSVTNHVFSDVLRAIYDGIDRTGYLLQLANTRYSTLAEENLLRLFLSQKPAGLIVAGTDQSPAARAMLEAAPCPVVQIMETGADPVDMLVGFSHYDAAGAAARHAIACGYRALGFLGARMDPRTQRRFAGFREAALAAGAFDERRVVTTPAASSYSVGAALLTELLERAPETDLVFCNNDDLAIGALFEARRRRIDVPERLGVIGFNDFEIAAAAEPSLTSVHTWREEMGEQALSMLIDAIEGRPPRQKIVDLGFKVIPRRSTRAPLVTV